MLNDIFYTYTWTNVKKWYTNVYGDSSVGIAMGCKAGVRFPAEVRFFSTPQRPDRHIHLVPRSRLVELNFHSPAYLYGVVIN
jgi:hypothetical protein